MKKILYIFLFSISVSFAQNGEKQRINQLRQQLEILATEVSGLNDVYKTEIDAVGLTLANLLLAVGDVHELNINPADELKNETISPNFPNVVVTDLLVYLCKEYSLTIDFTGTIMSVKKYVKEVEKPKALVIPITYELKDNTISIDAKSNKLYDVFRGIMDASGKNLVFAPGLENELITAYIQKVPFDSAMENLAIANNLFMEKSKEGFYIFESTNLSETTNPNNPGNTVPRQRPIRQRNSNFFFRVLDKEQQLLEVDFVNTPIADIINDIGNDLNIDIFTATPLDEAGMATFKAKRITFDHLLNKLFEISVFVNDSNNSNPNPNPNRPATATLPVTRRFSYKKENNIYYFGTTKQLSIQEVAVIQLKYRTIELLSDPSGGYSSRSAGRSSFSGTNNNFNRNTGVDNFSQNGNTQRSNRNFSSSGNQPLDQNAQSLESIIPTQLTSALKIQEDYELNSFYVTGASADIQRFRDFIEQIDKPIPLIQIEVMILEVSRTSTVETGVSWGIGEEPTTTQGGIFPETDLTLGANTINRIIGSFDSFGGVNLGSVVPNFFATIKAMESNGDLKIRSTPRLSTLNGHRAYFSNGQTSYYAVTDQAVIGSDNPVTTTAVNYVPIDAELGLTIKPTVSGDGQVTLDVSVIQSSFGARIAEEAPPDINSREFSSLIRMKDGDIAVLGGLEEQSKNNSGSGVPFLARIPIIKWLFSKRVREGRKAKLTVLIRPTVIY